MDDKNVFPLSKIPSNKAKTAAQATAPAPQPPVSAIAEREFVEGARTHSVPKSTRPAWRSLDPAERPTRGINVRFNDYELGLLHEIAEREGRSVHSIIKRLLIPAAQKAIEG